MDKDSLFVLDILVIFLRTLPCGAKSLWQNFKQADLDNRSKVFSKKMLILRVSTRGIEPCIMTLG